MFQITNLLTNLLYTVLLCAIGFNSFAQDKYGYEWVVGGYPAKAKANLPNFPTTFINYSNILGVTSACTSDSNGTLLFYTNGLKVFNREHKMMRGGDSLTYNKNNRLLEDERAEQGAIILPSLYNEERYVIFHNASYDTDAVHQNGLAPVANRLLYSYVDMKADSGRGEVISKNDVLLDNVLLDRARMTACKHANGRDWWIIKHGLWNNTYYKFLHTSTGIFGPFIQLIGPYFDDNRVPPNVFFGRSVFSEDGTKYATISGRGPIVVMDFDRCTGQFSNVRSFNYIYDVDSAKAAMGDPNHIPVPGGVSISFSPNSQYIYANHLRDIVQFEIDGIKKDSVRLITFPDTFPNSIDPGNWMIRTSQLAPNGKIYLSTYNGGISAFHVIHQPDSFGAACNFVPFGQQVNTISTTSLPNMPNYRLGKLMGSPCDTIISGIDETKINNTFSVFPNPANSYFTVSLKEYAPDVHLTVLDVTGKKVYQQNMYLEATIDASSYASGIYFIRVESQGKLIGVSKWIKE